MFWTQPSCPKCDYRGPDFMYMPHFERTFGVLVQNIVTLELRVVFFPDGEAAQSVIDGVPKAEVNEIWAAYVASIADPPLEKSERVVPVEEFFDAAISSELTAGTIPCPKCQHPLNWQMTGIT